MSETACVKIGGSAIDAPGMLDECARAVARVRAAGYFPVVVHGGGKDIGRQLALREKHAEFVEGMRVTDAETMTTVQMVLSGDVNKRIVNMLVGHGVASIGLSGVDMGLFEARKLTPNGVDIGFVGTIARVDIRVIDICRGNGIVPVVSPVSRSADGGIYNVNADLAASELAKALRCEHLIYVTDVDGVLLDGRVAHEIRTGDIERLAAEKYVTGGMLPKIRSAAEAVTSGVGHVHICGWHGEGTLIDELAAETRHGTVIF